MNFPSLREGMETSDRWKNLTEQARSIPEDTEMDPTAALDLWCRWLVDRTQRRFDGVVLLTGDEGQGKSSLALRMALRCAELAHVTWSPSQVCFGAIDLLREYQTAKRSQPVWYDEGVRDTMAGETFTPEQRAVVKALALVREKGAILFALYPSIWMAAKQIRARRACLWIHVVHRGLGRVHERDRRLNYLPTDALGLTISPRAPHVAWEPFAPNSKVWKAYLATKSEKLNDILHEAEADLRHRAAKRRGEEDASVKPPTPRARSEAAKASARERTRRWRKKRSGEDSTARTVP